MPSSAGSPGAPRPARLEPARRVRRSDFVDEADRRMRRVLDLAWPVQALVRLFVRHLGEPWLNGKITGQGVRIGPRQLGHVYESACEAAGRLQVTVPELFVVNGGAMEATLLGVGEQNTLVLSSALLDTMDEEQLLFVLGREMGHVKSQNVVYLTLLRWIKDTLGSAARGLAFPAMLVLQGWQRAAAFSADRAGLIVVQDLGTACGALLRTALGTSKHMTLPDLEEYTRCGLRDLLRHPLKSAPELLESRPFLPRRLAALYAFRAGPRFAELYPAMPWR
jgi:Zn-dependent protease with chaperone function